MALISIFNLPVRIVPFMMIVNLTLSFSGVSKTLSINSVTLNYLGRLSLPLYLLHLPIIYFVFIELPQPTAPIVSCVASIVAAVIALAIIDAARKRKFNKKA